MPNYSCKRCGYNTERKNNLKTHLNKKIKCDTVFSRISVEECLELINKRKGKVCMFCNKNFSTISNKNRHENTCKQKEKMEIEKVIKEKHEKDEVIEKLKTQIENNKNVKIKLDDEFIYIIQEREFIRSGRNIYKIGKTINPKSRLSSYPNGSRVYMLQLVDDCTKTEKELIELFDKKFEQCKNIGREYYKGEIKQMIKEFKKME